MSDKKNDGGPAFPMSSTVIRAGALESIRESCDGISVRDYLAAKAMQAQVSTHTNPEEHKEEIAKRSFALADAMILAREAK